MAWTYKEGTWIYWDGTFQADRFIGDGSQLTGLSELWTASGANIYRATGNVGIGTASPAVKLHLHESTGGSNYLYFTNADTGTTINDGSLFGLYSDETFMIWQRENKAIAFGTNNVDTMRLSATGGLSLGSTYYSTDPGSGNMIIQGNVGIGTTSPKTKLEVNGTASAAAVYVGVNPVLTSYTETDPIFIATSAALAYVAVASYAEVEAGVAASNAVVASAATWQAAVVNYPQGVAASNAIVASKALWALAGTTLADNDASGAAIIRGILVGVEATPGPANLYTQGTVYLKYTA